MVTTDPIADYLTRVRNAISARHRVVEIPASNVKKEITKVLYEKGYIQSYKFEDLGPQGQTKESAIVDLRRASKPGLRKYAKATALPRVLNGLGIAVMSTSKGIITDKEARTLNVGGEVLCYIY
ncbi:UNVERIFIED_CONTAM: hypothetical protein GTU68_037794 [Idotea baltica]|nr:hypothetical protein [Idotea baltica]